MARVILAGLLVSAALIVVAGYFLPGKFKLHQSIDVSAPPSYLYEEINDLEKWPVWSYWFARDTQVTFGERRSGIEASCSWKGNGNEGTVTILLNKSDELVRTRVEFQDVGIATCDFQLKPDSLDPLRTRLSMLVELSGKEDNVWTRWKLLLLATRFGSVFDYNLSSLKRIAETKPVFSPGITEELLAPSYYISIEIPSKSGQPAPSGIIEARKTLQKVLQQADVTADGYPFCLFFADSLAQALCGIPVPPDALLPASYPIAQLYSGAAIRGIDSAGYADVRKTHDEIVRYIRYKEYIPNGNAWEVYLTDPAHADDTSRWITQVYYPVK